jgi:mono/diheme cytochrome c family protein
MRKLYFMFFGLLIFSTGILGQEWSVPENRKGRLSPFKFTDQTRENGAKAYSVYCASCHGAPGRGNIINLVPPPPDPATDKFQKNSDGEIFFKITEGRQQMPSFRNVLISDEIWDIISFLRSFNSSYIQKVESVAVSSAYPGAAIKIGLSLVPGDSLIVFRASAISEKESLPVTGAAVRLYIYRNFGLLPVDEEKITNSTGVAGFRLPAGIPGDTAGNLRISARFSREDLFGGMSFDTIIRAGEKIRPVSLVANRALWNKARMAPVWIILTFSIGLLSVWSCIVFIMMKLRDIYIIGEVMSVANDENQSEST